MHAADNSGDVTIPVNFVSSTLPLVRGVAKHSERDDSIFSLFLFFYLWE